MRNIEKLLPCKPRTIHELWEVITLHASCKMYPVIKIGVLFQSLCRRNRVKMKSFAHATDCENFCPQVEGGRKNFSTKRKRSALPPQDRTSLLSFTRRRNVFHLREVENKRNGTRFCSLRVLCSRRNFVISE